MPQPPSRLATRCAGGATRGRAPRPHTYYRHIGTAYREHGHGPGLIYIQPLRYPRIPHARSELVHLATAVASQGHTRCIVGPLFEAHRLHARHRPATATGDALPGRASAPRAGQGGPQHGRAHRLLRLDLRRLGGGGLWAGRATARHAGALLVESSVIVVLVVVVLV